jgi:hypothetical protein
MIDQLRRVHCAEARGKIVARAGVESGNTRHAVASGCNVVKNRRAAARLTHRESIERRVCIPQPPPLALCR